MTMLTKIDISSSGILIVCTACPYWYAFALTMGAAHDSACGHEERVHPGANGASSRRTAWRKRDATRRTIRPT